jgi:Spy/CpxP family protein refolding chaperone
MRKLFLFLAAAAFIGGFALFACGPDSGTTAESSSAARGGRHALDGGTRGHGGGQHGGAGAGTGTDDQDEMEADEQDEDGGVEADDQDEDGGEDDDQDEAPRTADAGA